MQNANVDFEILIQAACKNYRGGITAIAQILGMSEVILANKLNPHCDRNHLTASELFAVLEITRDVRVLNALAGTANKVLTDKPETLPESGCHLLVQFANLGMKCGNVAEKIRLATDECSELGARLSRREKVEIAQVIDDLVSVALRMKGSLNVNKTPIPTWVWAGS